MIKGEGVQIIVESQRDKEISKKHNIFIRVPKEQDEITIDDICHILVSGISLLVKQSKHDAKLMKEIIEHLNSEFASADETYKNTHYLNEKSFPDLNNNSETEK